MFLAAVALLALALLAAHPWIAGVVVVLAGGVACWRWWERPRRRAKAEQAYVEQMERAEREREETAQRHLRERSQNLGGLLALTAHEFELRVGEILREHGYDQIEHVGRSGDLGIDLFATDPAGERVGIQCKRYAPDKLVRAPEVRLLYGDMTHASVRGMFVTTSGYTADATAYAESHSIVLIDGDRLAKLLAATVSKTALG
ncbi:MAG: restriction endonuclease [Gaiellaceae bacterium]